MKWPGLLNQIGFETVTASTGREGFEMAVRRSNVVLVAVETNVIRWPLSQTVSNLRADARSAQIPILVFGPESVRAEIRGLLTHYPQIEYMVESATPQNVEVQVGGFLKRAMALAAPPANRAERVVDATVVVGVDRQGEPNQSLQSGRRRVGPDGHLDRSVRLCQRAGGSCGHPDGVGPTTF